MLNLSDRIESLDALGNELKVQLQDYKNNTNTQSLFGEAVRQTVQSNSWFTEKSLLSAITAIIPWLNKESLLLWLSNYSESRAEITSKRVGVVMAGNIPLVNFHDVLCVLISGHILKGKLSSQDRYMLRYIKDELIKINTHWQDYMFFTEDKLQEFDAVIATGSNNTSRYFEYYFNKYPHIIRKNRSAVAVIHGDETTEEMVRLGNDIFAYFGLGCRNVAHVLLPLGFDPTRLLSVWDSFYEVSHHHKYHHNYDYQKAIMLINRIPFYDSGFLLLKEDKQLYSPVSVLHYSYYNHENEIASLLKSHAEQIQCVVSLKPIEGIYTILPGEAQQPGLVDYPDHIDVMKFLYAL
jgi:hypothetical protein